jgi:hypothetical protein
MSIAPVLAPYETDALKYTLIKTYQCLFSLYDPPARVSRRAVDHAPTPASAIPTAAAASAAIIAADWVSHAELPTYSRLGGRQQGPEDLQQPLLVPQPIGIVPSHGQPFPGRP